MTTVEGTIQVNGKDYRCECTYDGDSQYNVQVRDGKQVVATYKVSAGAEGEVLESARARFAADVEVGNVHG
ncbi:hypothetical protein [Brevibacillus sp. SAFN-007a]|uniref:hypothetical protein n=1 Tax=Brevibacillus sp. SAFN-007a TaxID=3436862 RepID=UPI003F7D8508